MAIQGKGIYIWQIKECEGGDPQAIASLAADARFSHALIKIADGTFTYNFDYDTNQDLVPPLADALRARGIDVWGWHYVYGDAPLGEARKAVQRMRELDLDGYVIDAEAQYKEEGKKAAARRFMSDLRSGLPNTEIGLTSYRFPSIHPQLPWREFLEKCDFNMPQVYWEFSHNPESQLTRTMREFQNLTPFRPLMPVGPAYKRGPWKPTPADLETYLNTAQSLNLQAVSFWEWSKVRAPELSDLWQTLRDYPWGGGAGPGDVVEHYFAALNARDPDHLTNLYTPTAAHIMPTHTKSGHDQIRAWYQTLFGTILPNATFTLSGFTGAGNSRQFTWTASSPQGQVQDGNDVFGLLDGKVVYHYSFFTVN